jgi:hypothetical protein
MQEEADRQQALENDESLDNEDERMDGMNSGKDEIDYRGFFLPDTCSKSVLFTRNQLLQLIER